MEELIGSKLLSIDGKIYSTQELLSETEFVAFYFSASWCGPCRHFTPQLKNFYHHVNSDTSKKFEVVFVSLDRSLASFYQYYASMPWLAIPLQIPGVSKNIVNALSSKLWVNTIPSLIVFTKDGLYVTNDAKLQVSSTVLSKADPNKLLESWRMKPHVPIEEANLGIIPSIYSSFKKGYNYFMGYNTSTEPKKLMDKNRVAATINENNQIPPKLLLSFFEKAVMRLDSYPSSTVQTKLLVINENAVHEGNNDVDLNGLEDRVPVSLPLHRQMILDEQIQALKEVVSAYNSEGGGTATSCDANGVCTLKTTNSFKEISVEDVQECLSLIGSEDYSKVMRNDVSNDDNDVTSIRTAMNSMNTSARNAYVLSVLWAESMWGSEHVCTPIIKEDQDIVSTVPGNFLCFHEKAKRILRFQTESSTNDEHQMDRSTIMEYCGLCITAMKISRVKDYISNGKDIFEGTNFNENKNLHFTSSIRRMNYIQSMFLCTLGYHPSYGSQKLVACLELNATDTTDDVELEDMLANYVKTMDSCAKNNENVQLKQDE